MSERCVSLRKDGQPYRGLGTIFDPEINGLVCDAHARPEINIKFQQRMRANLRMAQAYADHQRHQDGGDRNGKGLQRERPPHE